MIVESVRRPPGPAGSARARLAGPAAPALAFAVTLLVVCTGLGGPGPWRDEAATVSAARRPLPELLRLLDQVDVVHGAYYLLMQPLVALAGTGEIVLRLPSALAAAAAAAGVTVLGRRLGGPVAGLLAGLVYAVSPMVTRYGQEARPYALVSALAVLATWLLVRAVQDPSPRRWAAYAAGVVLLGLSNVFAVLLIPAHGAALWGRWRIARPWCVAVASTGIVLVPLLLGAARQRGQVDWILPPTTRDLQVLGAGLAGTAWLILPVAALAVYGLSQGRERRRIVLPWLVLPPCTLLAISLVAPVYHFRYVLFCLPAVALAVGAGLARLPVGWRAAALAALVAACLPLHVQLRQPDARVENLRGLAEVFRKHTRTGDGIYFPCNPDRLIMAPYPGALRKLTDITLREPPVAAGNLQGSRVGPDEALRRVRGLDRVWVLRLSTPEPCPRLAEKLGLIQRTAGFTRAGRRPFHGGYLTLYVPSRGDVGAGHQRRPAQ